MFKYFLRRTLYTLPILAGIILVTFFLFNISGGDPALQAAGKYATQEQVNEIREELGINRSLPMQFVFFVKQIVTFDFGRSWQTKQEITTMLTNAIPVSLSLTFPAFLLTILLTIPISLLMTHKRGSWFDKSTMIFALAALSMSSLVYILYLQYGLGYKAGWFPISGWDPSWSGRWAYLILPILIFIALTAGTYILYFRTMFVDEIYQDYVRTAKSKGVGPYVILFKHVLRNALVPIITLMVIQLPFLILGSVLIESFFTIPGVGSMLYQAIYNSDFPVIKAMTFFGAVIYMIFQLMADLLYGWVDPKIRLR